MSRIDAATLLLTWKQSVDAASFDGTYTDDKTVTGTKNCTNLKIFAVNYNVWEGRKRKEKRTEENIRQLPDKLFRDRRSSAS